MSSINVDTSDQPRGLLLERERELAVLEEVVTRSASGEGGVVLVEGPAGIGKTSLLRAARERGLAVGLHSLFARGSEMERGFPFGVVRQLFEHELADEDVRTKALEGPAGVAAPVIQSQVGGVVGGDPSFALLHGLYWLTVNLSSVRPLMLTVDDLHWCDGPSLRFLTYLVRRLEGLPLVFAAGVRTAETEAVPALDEIAGDPMTLSVELGPLSGDAVSEMVRRRLGEDPADEFVAVCHETTGGNPFLLDEMLKGLAVEGIRPDAAHTVMVAEVGSRAISRGVLARLARLGEPAVTVARSVAVLGDGAAPAIVAELAGLGEDEVRVGAAALVQAEIFDSQTMLSYAHPLVGSAVHFDMASLEREVQHRRAAELLAEAGERSERAAGHLLHVSPRGEAWVAETLLGAAELALTEGAPESAAALLRRAWEEPPSPDRRPQVLLRLGYAEVLGGGSEAIDHLEEAYGLIEDPLRRAQIARVFGTALFFTGKAEAAASLLRRAVSDLPVDSDLKNELEVLKLITAHGESDPRVLQRIDEYRTLPVGDSIGARMLATVAARRWMFSGGSADECARLVLEVLSDGKLIEADNGFIRIMAVGILARADRDEAVEAWQVSLADAHERGSISAKCAISWGLGFTALRRGELADAEEWFRTAISEYRLWGMGVLPGEMHSAALLSTVLMERGDVDAARRELERFADPGDRSDNARYWLNSRLEVLVAEERFTEAVEAADVFAERFAHLHNPVDTPWREHKALALHALGRTDEALALANDNVSLAREWAAPATLGRALRVLGTIDQRAGIKHLEEAVDVVRGSQARLEHAKSLAVLGARLRHVQRPRKARAHLREALELAERCGAGFVSDVRSELYAAGGRPRRTAVTGVEALTASERRVAHLAAKGDTNREIAQTLHVAPKTVEVHLTSVYRKLGIRSRHQLAAELATS